MRDAPAFVLATNNAGKRREMEALLAPWGVTLRLPSDFDSGVDFAPEETGAKFLDNARIKAKAALALTGLPSLADDSGLEVDALGGAPGVFSARYGGDLSPAGRNALLLREMEGKENRAARFVCVLCCLFPDGREVVAEGTCRGEILMSPRGSGGFGYDPVFYVPSLGRAMAELSDGEKNRISHRAKAVASLMQKMSKTNGSQAGKPPEGHVGNIGKTPESHVGKPPQSLVGFFGGSFNPPHNGHVSAALRAIDALGLDKLVVMTAREAPHKQLPPGSPPPEHRLAMARLAFEHLPRCEVSDWEIRRAAPTYTVDTLAHLRAGGGIPVLVVGSDMFLTLHEWKRTDEFLPVTRVAVLLRDALQGGHVRHYASFLSERYGTDVDCVVHTPVVISSTQLRAALGTGGGRDHLPAAVYEYIVANGLYRRPW